MLGKKHSRPPPGPTRKRRISLGGFTLIELLVAVAILAILAVAAAPSMGRIVARYRLTAAADELMTMMRYGQSEARMGKTITLSISGNDLTIKEGGTDLRHMSVSSRLTLNPSASLAAGNISFLANGQIRPSNKASGRLDNDGKGMLLLCSPRLPDKQNAIVIRFSGAELRRQQWSDGGGSGCSVIPPNSAD